MPFSLIILLILITLTWLSIQLFEKRNIFQTWLTPISQRFKEFMFGFVLMGILCILSQLFLSQLSGINWAISDEITISKLLHSIAYDINSVVIEELLFRGVLLYALIKYTTQQKGILLSAVLFGIYHWFSYGVLGNILGMTLVFITTGYMGLVFAISYVKTESIVLPLGIHLGWNWINNSIFSNGPNGIILLRPDQTVEVEGYISVIYLLWYLIIPTAVLLILNLSVKFLRKKRTSPIGIQKNSEVKSLPSTKYKNNA